MRTVALVLILVLSALAAGDVNSIEGLKGLREVAVVVDAFTPEQFQHGLNPIEFAAEMTVLLRVVVESAAAHTDRPVGLKITA